MSDRSFAAKSPCDECPWRKDSPIGRFPPERFERLRSTCEQGANKPLFACHKTQEGREVACVGWLIVEGHNNFAVRVALIQRRFSYDEIENSHPLYESYDEMARANGCKEKK